MLGGRDTSEDEFTKRLDVCAVFHSSSVCELVGGARQQLAAGRPALPVITDTIAREQSEQFG